MPTRARGNSLWVLCVLENELHYLIDSFYNQVDAVFIVQFIELLYVVVMGNFSIVFYFLLFFYFFSICAVRNRLRFFKKTLINWFSFNHIHLGVWSVAWGGYFNNWLGTWLYLTQWLLRSRRLWRHWWHLKMFALALSRDMGTLSWVNNLWDDSIALDWRNKFLFLAKRFYLA